MAPPPERDCARRPLELALAALALAFALHRSLQPMAETDLFFHLKLGDLIRARHAIPFRNLFSFTWPEYPDPDLAWAFQVTMSLLYEGRGFAAIVLGKSVLFTVAALLARQAARRAGAGPIAATLASVLAVAAADQRICERPHLVTFVGLGALSLLLAQQDEPDDETARDRTRRWWWIPLLTWVWANFHAGVFLCFVVLAAHLTGLWLEERRWPLPPRRTLGLLALTAAATFATPAGARLPRYLLWHTGLGATRIIEEFRRADPWDDPWFFTLLTVVVLAAVGFRRRHLRWTLPALVVAPLAFRSVRFVAEWAFLSTPILALAFQRAGEALGTPRTRRLAAAALAASVLYVIADERLGHPTALRLDLAEDVVPFAAIRFADEHGLRDRMYSDLDVGCYLLWEGWPRHPVFQDARLPAYPDVFHRALDQTPLEPAAFDRLLRQYGVDAALLGDPDINMRSGSFDPDEWALVYRGDGLVFARRTPAHAALIARYEIPLRVRFRFAGGAHVEPIARPPARSPVEPCEWQRRLAQALDGEGALERAEDVRLAALAQHCLRPDEEAEARFRLGVRLQLAGQLERAAAEYDRVLALEPDDRRALLNRAWARLLVDPAQASRDLERARGLGHDMTGP